MKITTKLTPNRVTRIREFIDALPDWAFVMDTQLSFDAQWTTPAGVWNVKFMFATMGQDATIKVCGRGLEMKYDEFADDDVSTIIVILTMMGAFPAREDDDA